MELIKFTGVPCGRNSHMVFEVEKIIGEHMESCRNSVRYTLNYFNFFWYSASAERSMN